MSQPETYVHATSNLFTASTWLVRDCEQMNPGPAGRIVVRMSAIKMKFVGTTWPLTTLFVYAPLRLVEMASYGSNIAQAFVCQSVS